MTAVFVCADEPTSIENLELGNATVTFVDDLCINPSQIASLVSDDETSLVMAVHRNVVGLGAIQSAVRQLGFDPLGVGIVDLESMTENGQATLACVGGVARVSHYPGSAPEQVKLLPSERKTRRGFLSLGAPVYVGAPLIHSPTCVAGDGCRVCVTACPADALSWAGGIVDYDVNVCVACGICVTTCPMGAIQNPVADPVALEAEMRAVITESREPIAIRYRCRDSSVNGEPGWYQIEVPCTGMLTVGWLLAPVLLGAAQSDAVSCSAGGCGLRNDQRLEMTMEDARQALEALSPYLAGPTERSHLPAGSGWLGNGSTGRVLAEMASGATDFSLALEVADVGLVSINPHFCTACEMCAQVCPTDALISTVDGRGVHIEHDPQHCVACSQCVDTCPEVEHGAIAMSHGFDLAEWLVGRREIRYEPTPTCEVCGEPVAPEAMLSRIEEMLGEDAAQTMALLRRRCVNCRGR